MNQNDALRSFLESLEKHPDLKRLTPEMKKMIKKSLESAQKQPAVFPIVTFEENGWFIASTPVIDVCAQGKTEKEAVDELKAMIDDYMADPDTEKPKANSVVNVHVGIISVPVKASFVEDAFKQEKGVVRCHAR